MRPALRRPDAGRVPAGRRLLCGSAAKPAALLPDAGCFAALQQVQHPLFEALLGRPIQRALGDVIRIPGFLDFTTSQQ